MQILICQYNSLYLNLKYIFKLYLLLLYFDELPVYSLTILKMATNKNIEIPLIVKKKNYINVSCFTCIMLFCMTVIRNNRIEAEWKIRSSSAKPMILQ